MADAFGCDPDQAQRLSERLLTITARISSQRTSGPQQGQTGSGIVESALAEFSTAMSSAQRNLAESVDSSATNFSSLVRGVTTLDQQEAGKV